MESLENLSQNDKEIIVYNHWLNTLPKSKLKKISLDLDADIADHLNKEAKRLEVDKDAVIGYALYNFVRSDECANLLTQSSTNKTTEKPEKRRKKSSKATK